MRRLHLIVITVIYFELCRAGDEEDLRVQALSAQTRLERMIYTPIQAGISDLNYAMTALMNRTKVIQSGHVEIIRSHVASTKATVGFLNDTYQSFGLSCTACISKIKDKLAQIEEDAVKKIEVTVDDLLFSGEMITYDILPVLAAAQNRTLVLRMIVQDCVTLGDEDCLHSVMGEILVRQTTLPLLIETAFTEHQTKMVTLDERISFELRQVSNNVKEEYVNLLDVFLNCIV